MAWTIEQITALETAIAQGTLKVKYQDREVTYRSLAEMLQLLRMMKDSLEGSSGGKIKAKKMEFSKGL